MLEELIKKEEAFQEHLLNRDYTFIGPSNQELMEEFIKNANNFAPIVSVSRSIHQVLSHKKSVRKAIDLLPPQTDLRIYVVKRSLGKQFLAHSTIDDYSKENNYPL